MRRRHRKDILRTQDAPEDRRTPSERGKEEGRRRVKKWRKRVMEDEKEKRRKRR